MPTTGDDPGDDLNFLDRLGSDDAPLRAPAPFRLPFRGLRNYLHSTDLFPALTSLAQQHFSPAAFVESMVLRRPVTHQVRASFVPEPKAFGTFRIRHLSQCIHGWLVETGVPISARVPFDEQTAVSAAICRRWFSCFHEPVQGYTAFEQLVVLMKVVSPQVGPHQWWFCRIELSAPLSESHPLSFAIRETVSDRFLVGDINQAHRLIGSAASVARNPGRNL
ncbi:MAG: hypothetical protein WB562_06280 [Candidatus Sulfotelmatobacter sp.]